MLFQYPPNTFNRVVFAMIRGIICQAHIDLFALCKLNNSLDELGTVTTILRTIIGINYNRMRINLLFYSRPQVLQGIYHKISRDAAGRKIKVIFINLWNKDAKKFDDCDRFKIMIGSSGAMSIISTSGIRTNFNRCFGINA